MIINIIILIKNYQYNKYKGDILLSFKISHKIVKESSKHILTRLNQLKQTPFRSGQLTKNKR